MKIALIIQNLPFIANGISQQGHYTKCALESCGYEIDLYCTEDAEAYKNIETIHILNAKTDLSTYSILLFVSSMINTHSDNNIAFLKKVKESGCKIVNMICGNMYWLLQEEYIFNVHNHMSQTYNNMLDEVWVLPMYDFSVPFLRTYFKTSIRVIPYVWNPKIILQNKFELPHFDVNCFNNKFASFVIAEPNVSMHKNAFTPLCIVERYYLDYKNTTGKALILGGNKIQNCSSFKHFQINFNIIKDKRVEFYQRCNFLEVLRQLKEKKNLFPIIVSHQFLNDLNFIHFEALYLGWPLLHNCPRLKDVGYYYPEHDIDKASELVEYIRIHHSKNIKSYKKSSMRFLLQYDPTFTLNTRIYKDIVEDLTSE